MRHVREAVFFDTLSGWCPTTLCVSGEDPPEGHHRGRVTDILDTLPLEAPMYYDLCGLDDMIFDVRDWLMERGVEKDRIHHEVFFRAPRKLPPLPPKKPPTHGA